MRKIVLIFITLLANDILFAQDVTVVPVVAAKPETEEKEPKLTAAIDVVYPYLWRGIKYYGDKIAFQPYINYAVSKKFSIGVWASTNFSNGADAYNEFDWSITYQVSPIVKVMLSDYYWPATTNNTDWEKSNYFDYSEGSAQSLDLSILFDFTDKGVPLDFQWNTFVGGGDYKYDDQGNSSRAFSSYAEVGYTKTFKRLGIDVRPFVGAVVINGGYYGNKADGSVGFTFSNVGVNIAKDIKITKKYTIPVYMRYTNNDYGIQKLDADDHVTKTVRNFFSCGMTFTIR